MQIGKVLPTRGGNELEIPSRPLKAQKGMKAEGSELFLESFRCAGLFTKEESTSDNKELQNILPQDLPELCIKLLKVVQSTPLSRHCSIWWLKALRKGISIFVICLS